ncbi:MAG: hypothetical protein JJV89_02695 [Desulfosarcina sp.]|nr:hypothetical protein [Desulfobacterales bacterium]
MKNIFNFFISTQAWKIFLIYFSILIMTGFLYFLNFSPFITNSLFYVINDLFILLWLYSVGCQLNPFMPPSQMNLRLFQVISLILFLILLSFFFCPPVFHAPFTIILLNLAFAFLVFFVAKSIVIAEANENGSFDSCLGVFVYIWIFPIGIWFVQPRIIKIIKK